MYSLSDYDYDLPADAIAQTPAKRRDGARLLTLARATGEISHSRFYQLPGLLKPADVLVLNNTAVIPARLVGRKETGGRVEVLLIDSLSDTDADSGSVCRCLMKANKVPQIGARLSFGETLSGRVAAFQDGLFTVHFFHAEPLESILNRIGRIPLPPYIKRADGRRDSRDAVDYQTVYARRRGAVAAPTAGLHFTRELLAKLHMLGVEVVQITLHVGHGTFLPVKTADIRKHQMHAERYEISPDTAAALNRARKAGRRIVAVGTTSVRTLEHAADPRGVIVPGRGSCNLFIYPGYRFRAVDAMITNFHLPRSTLLMLVSAFAGRQRILDAYAAAVRAGYRFYSYGDAMLIY